MADEQHNHSSHSSLYESSIINAQEATHSVTEDDPTTVEAEDHNGATEEKESFAQEESKFDVEPIDLPLPELSTEESLINVDKAEAKTAEAANAPPKAANISWIDDFSTSVPLPERSNTPYSSSNVSIKSASVVSVAATPSNALVRINESPSVLPPPPDPPSTHKLSTKAPPGSPIIDQIESEPPLPPHSWRHKKKSKTSDREFWKRGLSGLPSAPEPVTYMQTIEALSPHLPHLVNTLKRTRRHGINLTCFDYVDNLLVSEPNFTCKTDFEHASERQRKMLCLRLKNDIPPNVGLRLIMVDDLSVELIEILGSTFGISPEFFEEHLLNSGWRDGSYKDREVDTWNTRGMKKDYASIRWYRPVIPALRQLLSAEGRTRLLDPSDPELTWTESVLIRDSGRFENHGVKHKARLSMNILRRDWGLKTKISDDETTTVPLRSPVAWEERATVWSKQIDGCYFVILLLDPLPNLREQINGATSALEALGFSTREEKSTDSKKAKGTNVMEHNAVEKDTNEDSIGKHNIKGEDTKEKTNTQDRISISISEPFEAPPLVIRRTYAKARPQVQSRLSRFFTSPLSFFYPNSRDEESIVEAITNLEETVLPYKSESLGNEDVNGDERRNLRAKRRKLLIEILPPWLSRLSGRPLETKEDKENQEEAKEPEFDEEEEGTELITLGPIDNPIFSGIVPRGPMIKYDLFSSLDNIQFVAQQLGSTNSTATDLTHWVQHEEHKRLSNGIRLGPLDLLFNIINRDTMEIVRLMNLALSEISYDILDDSILQQRLLHWRYLLERFERELRHLQDSLQTFATFLLLPPITKLADSEKDTEDSHIEIQLELTLKQISDLRQRTTKSYKSLIANISIVESKRGIAEAESVTKLTELAFLFIPLTFSASIFSMQVSELNPTNVASLSAFFILAIFVTASSYGLRLFIRSASVVESWKHVLVQVRTDNDLPPGAPVPTRSFLVWLWHRFELLIVPTSFILATIAVAGIALLVAPLAVLWARHTNPGYSAVITILVLVSGLVSSFYVIKAMVRHDTRGWHLRRDIFKPSRGYMKYTRSSSAPNAVSRAFSCLSITWILISLVATGLAAGPLIAIWTRPLLEKGIKVSATLSIMVIYFVFLCFLAFTFGVNGSWRSRRRHHVSSSSLDTDIVTVY